MADKISPNMRTLAILQIVAQAGEAVSVADIQRHLPLPKPSLHRLVQTMEEAGYLQRDLNGKKYAPGPLGRELSVNIVSSTRIRAARLAVLNRVADHIGETCNLAIPDRHEMVYLDRVETSWPLRIQLPIGTKVPLYCTASGKIYLSTMRNEQRKTMLQAMELETHAKRTMTSADLIEAEIQLTKRQGYAVDYEEFVDGMLAIAVPVKGPNSRLFCTLSFHAPIQRIGLEKARSFVPELKDAAKQLAALL